MSKGYLIPDVLEPENSRCVTLFIPDDPGHIDAFWGQLFELARWWVWERDEAHSGAVLARVWRGVILEAQNRFQDGECGDVSQFQIRLTGCDLEYSTDGGENWLLAGSLDADDCPAIKGDKGDPGEQGPPGGGGQAPGEQPGGGSIPSGECRTLDLTVPGNQAMNIPYDIGEGYTVELLDASGSWSDGSNGHISFWSCYQGKRFLLGACAQDQAALQNDPNQSVNHMALILRDASGTLNEGLIIGSPVTIPAGCSEPFTLQANDSPISDNFGGILASLEICSEAPYCYDFDFTAGQQGWVAQGATLAQYAGTGWIKGSTDQTDHVCYVQYVHGSDFNVSRVEMQVTNPAAHFSMIRLLDAGDNILAEQNSPSTSPVVLVGNYTGVRKILLFQQTGVPTSSPVWTGSIQHCIVEGPGSNPFGMDNCG